MSLSTANMIYTWSNAALILGAVLTLMGVFGVARSGRIRDHYADARAAQLMHDTAAANAVAAKANERAALANERVGELTKSNTFLQLALEREKIARLRLERVVPRRLTSTQINGEAAHLSQFHGQLFFISFPIGDDEAHGFAEDLYKLFIAAHWQSMSEAPNTVGPGTNPAVVKPGIRVFVASGAPPRMVDAAKELVLALQRLGFDPVKHVEIYPELPSGFVDLMIGPQTP